VSLHYTSSMGSLGRSGIAAVADAHPETTFYPDSETYKRIALNCWAENTILRPSCLFVPRSAEELSQGFQLIAKNEITFAVRGGGHGSNKGWNNIDGDKYSGGGILVSVAAFTECELLREGGREIVRIGTGANLLDVYEYMDDKGITIAAGERGNQFSSECF
jgi:FAD/FMN-containing dehydrogenase